MLPEKHPTVPNAHTRFEEVNAAFVRVNDSVSVGSFVWNILIFQLINHYKNEGETTDQLLPGEIFVNNFQLTLHLQPGSSSTWKKAIRTMNPNVIVGSQKTTTNLNMRGTKGNY